MVRLDGESVSVGTFRDRSLVVDDEALLRFVATDFLEDEGYRVLKASDAQAALDILATRSDVRLVFTDIQMPGRLDGLDLAREVHRRWPAILLVVTSGRVRPRDEDIPEHGRFLAKPYNGVSLLGEVNAMVARPL